MQNSPETVHETNLPQVINVPIGITRSNSSKRNRKNNESSTKSNHANSTVENPTINIDAEEDYVASNGNHVEFSPEDTNGRNDSNNEDNNNSANNGINNDSNTVSVPLQNKPRRRKRNPESTSKNHSLSSSKSQSSLVNKLQFLKNLYHKDNKYKDLTNSQLRKAFSEFYFGLFLLQNFSEMNRTGFMKIVKKHDKFIGTTTKGEFENRLKTITLFHQQTELKQLIKETEVKLWCFTIDE